LALKGSDAVHKMHEEEIINAYKTMIMKLHKVNLTSNKMGKRSRCSCA